MEFVLLRKVVAPPSAIVSTGVVLSWNTAMLPVEVPLVTLRASEEPPVNPEPTAKCAVDCSTREVKS